MCDHALCITPIAVEPVIAPLTDIIIFVGVATCVMTWLQILYKLLCNKLHVGVGLRWLSLQHCQIIIHLYMWHTASYALSLPHIIVMQVGLHSVCDSPTLNSAVAVMLIIKSHLYS